MMIPGDRTPVADEPTTLLVGRAREQAALSDRLAKALGGRGGPVLIGGEAGIGKTALAEALGREAEGQGALVFVGRCYDLSETPPYGPWIELFERLPTDQDRARLPSPLGSGGPAESQQALFAQVRDVLAALSARRPLLLLLDDLHWADPASLDLLRSLARRVSTLPVLLLATYRADEITRRHPLHQLVPALVREAQAARIDLRRLGDAALRALVEALHPLPAADVERLVAYLQAHAEGTPFYVGELLRALEEEGTLRPTAEGWALGDLAQARVPPLLRQVIEGRLARLGEQTQQFLAVAAVIGQEVPLDLWAAVSGADEDALLDVLERAVEARLLHEAPDGAAARFAHALIREALYEGILGPRRRAWHRRVADTLLARPRPDPDAVAYHLRQAGDARAAAWLVRAGAAAERAYAWLTAAERYEAALRLLETQGADAGARGWLLYRLAGLYRQADQRRGLACAEEAARLAAEAGDRALAAAALAEQGMHHGMLGDFPRGVAALEAAAAAAQALPPGERARLDFYRARTATGYAMVGRFAEALALGGRVAAQGTAPAQAPGPADADGGTGGEVYLGLGIAHAMLGQPEAARRAFAAARDAWRASGRHLSRGNAAEFELQLVALAYSPEQLAARRRLAAEVAEALGRAGGIGVRLPRLFCAPLLVLEGDWAEARALATAGRTAASNAPARRKAMGWLGVLARAQGEPELAWAQVREALPDGPATAPDSIDCIDPPHILRLAAALALDAGDLAVARAWLACHDRWLAWTGAVLGRSEGQLGWAAYHRAAGEAGRAREHAERALAHASAPRQPLALLAAHRLLGEFDTAAGSHAEAAAHLDRALALAEVCAAPYERALTLLALAELRAATGQREDALAMLGEVRAICGPLDARPTLARADALAARLTPARAVGYPAGLSAREVEVLRLVAQGLSDAQIAERLYLSVHTVKTHLRSIYNKLGVASRNAATRFTLEHHLG